MRTRGETRTSRCVSLLLHGEANRLDVDRIARLNGNVVVAGFHVRDLNDYLFLVLFYECGLVIGFVVGEEYGGNGAFSQILSRHGHGVIHFAGRRIYTRHQRRALRKEQRAQQRQQDRCNQKRQCRMVAGSFFALTTHDADRVRLLLHAFNLQQQAVLTAAASKNVMPYLAHNAVDYMPIGKHPPRGSSP